MYCAGRTRRIDILSLSLTVVLSGIQGLHLGYKVSFKITLRCMNISVTQMRPPKWSGEASVRPDRSLPGQTGKSNRNSATYQQVLLKALRAIQLNTVLQTHPLSTDFLIPAARL
jgi:hypothetical protein